PHKDLNPIWHSPGPAREHPKKRGRQGDNPDPACHGLEMLQGTQRHVSSMTMGNNNGCNVGILQVCSQLLGQFSSCAVSGMNRVGSAPEKCVNRPVERRALEGRIQPCVKLRALLKPPPLVRWEQGDFAALREEPAAPCAVHKND